MVGGGTKLNWHPIAGGRKPRKEKGAGVTHEKENQSNESFKKGGVGKKTVAFELMGDPKKGSYLGSRTEG